MNALKHGLRARSFALLPEEGRAEALPAAAAVAKGQA